MQKIMFNDRFLLTQAVLSGRKTQTRRFVKLKMINDYCSMLGANETGYICGFNDSIEEFLLEHYSRYKVGEVVAVAQNYKDAGVGFEDLAKDADILSIKSKVNGYSNKMFVKPDLMPHQVRITNVRLERLQDITDDECLLEGIEKEERTDGAYNYIFFDARRELYIRERTPRDAYARLIDAISGKGTWYSNPYVFVYDFELVR